jgi:hypothetical protein
MIGAAKLDVPTYESIEHDESATTQALTVVIIAAIAGGIGAITESDSPILGLVGGVVGGIVGWILFSAVAYFVGTKLLPGKDTSATIGQLLRTMGFAQVPGILSVFGILGAIGGIFVFIGSIWGLVTAIVGLRQALDISTGRAIAVGIVAAIASAIVLAIILIPFGIAAWAVA